MVLYKAEVEMTESSVKILPGAQQGAAGGAGGAADHLHPPVNQQKFRL